ncbi:hypothetical protein [Pseudomonas sp. HLS-6]|uniref:hypothetical protein n=1 Tax=Pseudomonas sp. HLS-6 TaxID=2049589 RepID=UPI0012FD7D8B|nr:hypothetical protein [Pseudomonas sp. HLS-6]
MPKNKTQQNRAHQPIAGSGNARKAAKDFRLAPAKRQCGGRTHAAKTKTGKAGTPAPQVIPNLPVFCRRWLGVLLDWPGAYLAW